MQELSEKLIGEKCPLYNEIQSNGAWNMRIFIVDKLNWIESGFQQIFTQ